MYFFQLIPNWLNSCLKKLLLKRVIRKPSQKFPGLFLKKKGLNSSLPKHMAMKSKCLVFKSFKKALNEFSNPNVFDKRVLIQMPKYLLI
jgi:hypothetical protein